MRYNLIISLSLCVAINYLQAQQDTLLYKQGKEQFDKKNYKKAIKCFSQAIELKKKYAEAYYGRGLCYFDKSKYKKTLKDFELASNLKPKDSDYYNAIGELYVIMKNTEEAIMNFNKAIKYDSLNAGAWNNRAATFYDREDYIKAEHDYLKAISYGKKENKGMYYTNLGAMYLYIKKYESAIEELTHAVELNYTDKDTYLYRAKAYDALGKTKEADEDRKKARDFKIAKRFQ